MANDRLFRPNIYLGLAYVEAFADPAHPTAAELNNATLVKDFTCALWEDGTSFTLGDSDTDDGMTFCDASGTTTLTTQSASVVYQILRDKDRNVTGGLYNTARDHLIYPDVTYYAIERVGLPNTTAFAVGQKIRIVKVTTDNPVDDLAADANALLTQNLLQAGFIAWNIPIAA